MPLLKSLKNTFTNLLLVLFSILVCFLLLEAGFRLAGYQPIYQTYSKSSMLWQYDPLLGWSHIPDSEGEYIGPRPWPVEYDTKIQINSEGLRGPEITKKNGLRILVLGDSITAGFEVPFKDTYSAQLQLLLNKKLDTPVQVINAGVRGYGTDQSFLYYKEKGKNLQADLVLFQHVSNDPLNNITLHRMRRPFGKPAFQLKPKEYGGELNLTAYPTPRYPICSEFRLDQDFHVKRLDTALNRTLCQIQVNLTDYSAFFTYITMLIRQHPDMLKKLYFAASPKAAQASSATISKTEQNKTPGKSGSAHKASIGDLLTTSIINKLDKTVKNNKARFALLLSDDFQPEQVNKKWLQEKDVRIIATTSIFPDRVFAPPYSFKNDSHWTKKGHRAYAEKIAPKVLSLLSEMGYH